MVYTTLFDLMTAMQEASPDDDAGIVTMVKRLLDTKGIVWLGDVTGITELWTSSADRQG